MSSRWMEDKEKIKHMKWQIFSALGILFEESLTPLERSNVNAVKNKELVNMEYHQTKEIELLLRELYAKLDVLAQ